MRTHLFRGVLALVLALAVCAPAVAQSTGMVKGRVVDAEGKPVADARITVEFPAGGRKNETKTNGKGEYIQIGLVPGEYKVTATKDKIGTQMFQVRVRVGAPAELNFQLTPTSGLTAEDTKKNAAIQATFNAGVEASKSGNHDAAIAKFTEAAGLMPNCADCYYNIGFAYAQKQQWAEAEAAYKKSIEFKPDSSEAYNGLATIYNSQKKFDQAAAASAKAAELSGGAAGAVGASAEALYNQGVILWNGGKYAEAKVQFESAIKADPKMADAHYQLGMANLNLGQLPAAIAAFEGYLAAAPNGPKAAEVKTFLTQLKK
jgi:tetratricopeptide (TPR) repeat protein